MFQFNPAAQQAGESENPMNTTNLELLLWIEDVIHNNLDITSPSSLAGATHGVVPVVMFHLWGLFSLRRKQQIRSPTTELKAFFVGILNHAPFWG